MRLNYREIANMAMAFGTAAIAMVLLMVVAGTNRPLPIAIVAALSLTTMFVGAELRRRATGMEVRLPGEDVAQLGLAIGAFAMVGSLLIGASGDGTVATLATIAFVAAWLLAVSAALLGEVTTWDNGGASA